MKPWNRVLSWIRSPVAILLLLWLGLNAYLLIHPDLMRTLLVRGSYYAMVGIFLLWILQVYNYSQHIHFSCAEFFRNNKWGIGIALGVTILVFITSPPDYRVLSDETNLLSVSQSLTYQKEIWNTLMGKWFYDSFHPLQQEIPTRPLMFPFLVSILHTFLGYDRQNIFILNFIFLFGFLSLVYSVTRRLLNPSCGVAAILLVIAQPIIPLSATSGGFDLASMVFFVLVSLVYYSCLQRRDDASFQLLCMTVLMFINIRYESIIVIPILLASLVMAQAIDIKWIQNKLYFYFLLLLLILPLPWQQIIQRDHFKETDDLLFSWNYIIPHFQELSLSLLNFNGSLPFAGWLNLTSLILALGLAIYCLWLRKKYWSQSLYSNFIGTIFFLIIAINLVYLLHHAGQASIPTQSRFFITIAATLSLVPLVFKVLTHHPSSKTILLFSVVMLLLYYPVTLQNQSYEALILPRKTRYVRDFLQDLPSKSMLIVIDRPGQYTVEEYGAVDFNYVNTSFSSIEQDLKNHLYQDLIVVQDMDIQSRQPVVSNQLDVPLKLLPLSQRQMSEAEFVQISRAQMGEVPLKAGQD